MNVRGLPWGDILWNLLVAVPLIVAATGAINAAWNRLAGTHEFERAVDEALSVANGEEVDR